MKYTDSRPASTKLVRHIAVEGGPVHPMAFSSTGKTFRVSHVTLPYEMTAPGIWEVRNAGGVDLTGRVLRKDGTEGRNHHSRRPDEYTFRHGTALRFTGEWEWINDLIDLARPVGPVTLPPAGGRR